MTCSPSFLWAAFLLVTCWVEGEAVAATASADDLKRAKQRVPRPNWKGDSFAHMSKVLTASLVKSGHSVRACEQWSLPELRQLQRKLFHHSHKDILEVYDKVQDNRRQRFKSLAALERHWSEVASAAEGSEELLEVARDGHCHEAVMWAVHHLSSSQLRSLTAEGLVLPSLPTVRHEPQVVHSAEKSHSAVHAAYKQQVSCQQCHTGKIVDPSWQNASLPGPEDIHPWVDPKHPGRERLRRCNFRMEPFCGPCDGLGGRRWGDGPEEFTPMKCEPIHGPEKRPTTRGCYPALGTAGMTGETRDPLEVFPTGEPGKYPTLNGSVYMGDSGDVMRLRYEFGGMGGQISLQTLEQAKSMNPGATVGVFGNQCVCTKSIAGNFHQCSFEADDPLDPLKLPGSEGGAAYLGRVRVTLDGDVEASQREAIADHFMKWAFHFLVDADEKSPSFGLPLRLYGAGGVRMVFHNWKIGDPATAWPDVWALPKHCNVTAPECSIFGQSVIV